MFTHNIYIYIYAFDYLVNLVHKKHMETETTGHTQLLICYLFGRQGKKNWSIYNLNLVGLPILNYFDLIYIYIYIIFNPLKFH